MGHKMKEMQTFKYNVTQVMGLSLAVILKMAAALEVHLTRVPPLTSLSQVFNDYLSSIPQSTFIIFQEELA